MVDWPHSLIREIAAERCIIFLGAGISAASKKADGSSSMKTWGQFLTAATALIKDAKNKAIVKALLDEKNYLLTLQGIRDFVDRADYMAFLDTEFNSTEFQPNNLHEIINKLDARIVITNNFDTLYEKYCARFTGGFKTLHYDNKSLFDELRSDTRLIIKAHGCITNINKMVFTRADYHRAKAENSGFYEVLRALFMTNTVLFLGCSMTDPDVALLLEDVKITTAASKCHYALVLEGNNPVVTKDLQDTYNVKVLTYGPSHDALAAELQELLDLVIGERSKTSASLSSPV
jgi:NAD-dependent SIR2 family protein deacetylase